MICWPDPEEALLELFVEHRKLRTAGPRYRTSLRRFQRFVRERTGKLGLAEEVIVAWIRKRSKESPLQPVLKEGRLISSFLDWQVGRQVLPCNPIVDLRRKYRLRSTTAVIRAMMAPRPRAALQAQEPAARYGSHLGPAILGHVERMQTLGFRYDENRFLHFDRFLQQRPDAAAETLATLIREYAEQAGSAVSKLNRFKLGRVLAGALNRQGIPTVSPANDRLLVQEMLRKRRQPYIYTEDEIQLLLETARCYPSPKAPLRPVTLYTMLVLGYCAGLRMGEIVGLKLKDIDLKAGAIEVRDTKFFKSRRLPLSTSALAALEIYVERRKQAGASTSPESPLFWHAKGAYHYIVAERLLCSVIHAAGLRKMPGRNGPRIHDLRHTFVVHRMTEWYRHGINPQSHLPYLAAYLGHKDIHSTLVYLTVTRELLQRANGRFRTAEAIVLKAIRGE